MEYAYPNNMSIRFEIINISNNVFYYKTITYNNSLPLKIEIKGPFNISNGKFPFISSINPAKTVIRAFTYKPYESEYNYKTIKSRNRIKWNRKYNDSYR